MGRVDMAAAVHRSLRKRPRCKGRQGDFPYVSHEHLDPLQLCARTVKIVALRDRAVRATFASVLDAKSPAMAFPRLLLLIGADLLRLSDMRGLAVPMAAIGGAGSFDGIFLSGTIAVLLA